MNLLFGKYFGHESRSRTVLGSEDKTIRKSCSTGVYNLVENKKD
jgi:hypothetical protein